MSWLCFRSHRKVEVTMKLKLSTEEKKIKHCIINVYTNFTTIYYLRYYTIIIIKERETSGN